MDILEFLQDIHGHTISTDQLPPQAIPLKGKNDRWKKATMQALANIARKQYRENLKYNDLDRMLDGSVSFREISKVMPSLREVEGFLNDANIPANIKHYDFLGEVVNRLVSIYSQFKDKVVVTNSDEFASNDMNREKTELFHKYLREKFQRESALRLLEMGINPEPDNASELTPEQIEQYKQEYAQKQQEMTPTEIEHYMTKTWKTTAAKWGDHRIVADNLRFHLDEMDRNDAMSYFKTGKCFRHFKIGYDTFKPESWKVQEVFYDKDSDEKYVQHRDYVGRIRYITSTTVIAENGHLMTEKEIKMVVNGETQHDTLVDRGDGKSHIVPFAGYYDYVDLLDIQESTGIPLGNSIRLNDDGEEEAVNRFLPAPFNANISQRGMGRTENVRADLIEEVFAYWVSFKHVALLTWRTDAGVLISELVTEEILKDFLEDNNIKKLRRVTLKEARDNPEENTIVFTYAPEVWQGKILTGGNLKAPMYLDVRPIDTQLRGDSNIYDVMLPVAGIIQPSPLNPLLPFQEGYNVAMNQAYKFMEKEIGLFFIFDIQYLPSEFKDWGNHEETLFHFRQLVKDVGLFPIDGSKQNTSGSSFNQFAAQNLSYGNEIAAKMNLADSYRFKALTKLGLVDGSGMQGIEVYYDDLSEYNTRMLDMHLAVAQATTIDHTDIAVFYSDTDISNAYINFSDPDFPLRKLGVRATTDIRKQQQLQTYKEAIMKNNTIGTDEFALAEFITSTSMRDIMEAARAERLRREGSQQQQYAQQQDLQQKQLDAAKESATLLHERNKEIEIIRADAKIKGSELNALGRAVDNESSQKGLETIINNADVALAREKTKAAIANQKTQVDLAKHNSEMEFKYKEMELKLKEIQARIDAKKADKYIATINKN